MNTQTSNSPASQQQISNHEYNRPSEPSRTRSSPSGSGSSHRPDLANGRGGKKSVSFGGNSTRGSGEGSRNHEQGALGTVAERGEVAGPFKMDKTEREMYAALKASQEEADLSQARRLSEAAEEGRIFNLTLAHSAEQAANAQRIRDEDERQFQEALRESIKGKERETADHDEIGAREEREELEMVLALSLEETSRRNGGVETSAQAFERYTREESATRRYSPEFQSERSPYHGETVAEDSGSLPYNYAEVQDHPEQDGLLSLPPTTEPNLSRRPSSFVITNPDMEDEEFPPPPPAYAPLPLSSSPQPHPVDTIPPAIPRPGPAPLSRASSNDGSIPSRISYSFDNHRLSHLSSTPRAGSFSTTSSRSYDRRSSASSSILSLSSSAYDPSVEPPPQTQTMSNAASFYSTSVGAALGFATPPATMVAAAGSSIAALDLGGGTSRFEARTTASPLQEELQDPFDERFAAVDVRNEYQDASDDDEVEPITPAAGHDYGNSMYRDKPYDSPIIIPPKTQISRSLALAIDTSSYYRPQPQSTPELTDSSSPATSELTPSGISPIATTTIATTSSSFPASSTTAHFMSTPSSGGLVDSCSVNAIADAVVLAGVRFDFVPPVSPASSTSRARSTHPPLDFEGPFPDMAQLSRFEDGSKKGYRTFAIEAVTFSDLLTYLMWHGNSQIEASPRDLAKEKGPLSASLTVEFFKSFTDGQTRVRLLIDLLAPPRHYDAFYDENLPSNFDRDCPNVTVALTTLPLPLSLSKLATTLSAYHTTARTRKRLFSSSSSTTTLPLSKSLKHLPTAINLIRSLNGLELFGQVQEDEEEEGRLIRLKGKLKRRKKVPGLVEGSEPGRRVGVHYPEGAVLVTPFAL